MATPRELVTNRQAQILDLLVTGITNEEIAKELFISVSSVKSHLQAVSRNIPSMYGASRVRLAVWWLNYKGAMLQGACQAAYEAGQKSIINKPVGAATPQTFENWLEGLE